MKRIVEWTDEKELSLELGSKTEDREMGDKETELEKTRVKRWR